ncbi:MAG: DUF503 domain-containing protein [Anaerolineales bacterium]
MPVGLLIMHLRLPGCSSLKEKRSRLKPLLARLHREFNISVAEYGHNDSWQEAVVACALVSNDNGQTQRSMQKVLKWVDRSWPDVDLEYEQMEII